MLRQNFGGQTKSIMVFLQVTYSEILSVLFQREMPLMASVFNEAQGVVKTNWSNSSFEKSKQQQKQTFA